MRQNKFNGILGVWIILLAFLDFSDTMKQIFLIITGIAMIVANFWGRHLFKSAEELILIDKKLQNAEKNIQENTNSGSN